MKYLKFWRLLAPSFWEELFDMNKHSNPCGVFIVIALVTFIILRTGAGLVNANKSEYCIVRSYGDIIVAPFYAIGCQIGKDRFNYRLN